MTVDPEPPVRARLGEILVSRGALTAAQLAYALEEQRRLSLPIGRALVSLQYVTDEALHEALAEQAGVACVDLEAAALDRSLARVINRGYARRHALVPVARSAATLTVAMDDPFARVVVDELGRVTGLSVRVVTAPGAAIDRALRRLYDEGTPDGALGGEERLVSSPAAGSDPDGAAVRRASEGQRADHLFRRVLELALEERASDIHLEMLPSGLSLRLRVDGVLRHPPLGRFQDSLDRHAREVVSRVKVLAALDIAERRRPQDGSFQVRVERAGAIATVDLRVSVLPSHSGESVVIRLLDRSRAPKGLADLDLSPVVAERLDGLLRRPSGILLVTGPTGSGKSTTLYGCLMRLNRPGIRILTAEDPVEYIYDGLSQSEVNPAIGNTFAGYLRAFLRHDPEVIMIGEIRDEETAGMAFRAAQTGHLLLSTLHTNSAVAALPRLLDLGVDASLVASSLVGVLSQRLVRRICSSCRQPWPASSDAPADLFGSPPAGLALYRGAGCAECGFTGYRGRTLVADLWTPDDEDLMLIMRRAPFDVIRRSAERTTVSMAADAEARLLAGETTPDELLRVLPHSAIAELRRGYGGSHRPAASGQTRE